MSGAPVKPPRSESSSGSLTRARARSITASSTGCGRSSLPVSILSSSSSERTPTSSSILAASGSLLAPRSLIIRAISFRSLVLRSAISEPPSVRVPSGAQVYYVRGAPVGQPSPGVLLGCSDGPSDGPGRQAKKRRNRTQACTLEAETHAVRGCCEGSGGDVKREEPAQHPQLLECGEHFELPQSLRTDYAPKLVRFSGTLGWQREVKVTPG